MEKTTDYHIKIQHGDEIRRFVLFPVTYSNLLTTIRTIFSLDPHTPLVTKFLDDEGDWVTFNSDDELGYAQELATGPTRISFKIPGPAVQKIEDKVHSIPTSIEQPDAPKGRGKGMRGRGNSRGRGRGRGKERQNLSAEEILQNKTTRLNQRIQTLQAKIDSGTIPRDRVRVLTWRLQKLQAKLDNVQSVGRTRGEDRPWRQVLAELKADKRKLQMDAKAARAAGNQEAFELHKRAVKEKKQEIRKLKDEHFDPAVKEKLKQAKQDLRDARNAGDQEKIQQCLLSLRQLRKDMKDAG